MGTCFTANSATQSQWRGSSLITAQANTHSVFIIEDDIPTCERLVDTVQRGKTLQVAGTANTLGEAQEKLDQISRCDILLTDLGLPDGDGADLITVLSRMREPPRILVITVFGDERRVIRAIEAGANGYLLKDSDEDALVEAIYKTLDGECPINPAIARHLLKRFHTDAPTEQESPLTPKETEVLKLIARGYSNSEVGDLLNQSVHTVTTHTKNIYRKLAVNSRSEAVFEASQLGLIEVGGRGAPGSD